MGICFCRWVFGFCCEVFGFAVRSLVLPWGILILSWGILILSWGILVLPWGILILPWGILTLSWGILVLPWGFWFCRDSCGPLYFLPPGKNLVLSSRNIGQINHQPLAVRSALPSILSVILYCRSWSTTRSGLPSLLFVQVGLARIVG